MEQQNTNQREFFSFDIDEPKPNYIANYEVKDYSSKFMKFGQDNLLPQFIAQLKEKSPIHGGIIDTKIKLVTGNKINIEGVSNEFKKWNGTLVKEIEKCIKDLVVSDFFALHIIPNRVGGIAKIEHIDWTKVRLGLKNDLNEVTEILVSNDWENTRQKENRIKVYKAFNPNKIEDSIYIFDAYFPGKKYYTLPSYIGALNSILTDAEISKLHLNHLLNGLFPSHHIEYPNKPKSIEERLNFARGIANEFRGATRTGKQFISFKEKGEDGVKITPINSNDTADKFLSLAEKSIQDILSAHGVTSPLLFGIRVAGQLGGREELIDAQELFHNRYVLPTQKIIIDEFKTLLGIDITFEQTSLLSNKLSEQTLQLILSEDELRKIAGYEPKEEINIEQ